MSIEPDTKDWTWVLEKTCEECGFDVRSFPREQTGELIRENVIEWKELLAHPKVSERPSDDRWSGLEYGCHVRHVFILYDERLQMMLEQDDPTYPNWDQDEAAKSGNYAVQDPHRVSAELAAAGAALAARFDRLEGDQWERRGHRSDGADFTIESFARYLLHDPVHHVHDVKQGYAKLSS